MTYAGGLDTALARVLALGKRRFRGRKKRMRRCDVWPASLAFSLCVLIGSLSVLAYASPPDPSWVRGVYDDADFDDVICLILANTGLVGDHASVEGCPDFVLLRAELPPDDLSVAHFSLSSVQPRAPPTISASPLAR